MGIETFAIKAPANENGMRELTQCAREGNQREFERVLTNYCELRMLREVRGRVKMIVERSTNRWQILILVILAEKKKMVEELLLWAGFMTIRARFLPLVCNLEHSSEALALDACFGVNGWEPCTCLFLTMVFC